MTTTNYYNTFIQSADDSPATHGEQPPLRPEKQQSVAALQFDMIANHPYRYTSDDVLFEVFAIRHQVDPQHYPSERKNFFSKGQACFRSSPLTKRYGWGVHSDEKGRIAIYGMETPEYRRFMKDDKVEKVKSMKRSRKD